MVLDQEQQLQEQADRDLADSGSLFSVFMYPALMLCAALGGELWQSHTVPVLILVCLTLFVALIRLGLGRRLRLAPFSQLSTWKFRYSAIILTQAVLWSAYSSWSIGLYGLSWSGVLVVIISMGLVAASTSNLTPNWPLLTAYILTVMLPSSCILALHANPSERLTAGLLVLFSSFMISAGKRHTLRYFKLSRALSDLNWSREQQEQLLLRWRSLVENAPEIIATVNRDGKIGFVNHALDELQPEFFVGMPVGKFLESADRDRVILRLKEAFDENIPVEFETKVINPQGKSLGRFSCRVGPICQNNQVDSVVVIATDVTHRYEMELALRQSRAQLQRLTAHQQAAVEEERRHISREIHDELGQLLTALKLELSWMEKRLDEGPVRDKADEMSHLLDNTIATVRRISSRLRPPLLDELGAGPALDWLVQDICTRARLRYRVQIGLGGRTLSESQSLALYRVCQEALTNIARHARASEVDVQLRILENQVVLTVQDDGIGISTDQVTASLGLLGLQERVTLLGGTVQIESHPGKGTQLQARIPL